MRHYEQIFVLKPTLSQEEIENRVEQIRSNIANNGGNVLAYQEMGFRKLAYKVQNHKRGYYGVFYFTIEPSAIFELERLLRISEDVIKFLTVKYITKKDIKSFQNMVNKANGKEVSDEHKEVSVSTDTAEETVSQHENSENQ
ncbi:MAG TPA: 30S ribosomal protein S6 [Campylobacterales bacterium]|nr:30S ribosomal protein S6 [Campylobacterales bacterium]HIO71141.1 30S ribosomal protein S6 [Campylobacterales bacterium]